MTHSTLLRLSKALTLSFLAVFLLTAASFATQEGKCKCNGRMWSIPFIGWVGFNCVTEGATCSGGQGTCKVVVDADKNERCQCVNDAGEGSFDKFCKCNLWWVEENTNPQCAHIDCTRSGSESNCERLHVTLWNQYACRCP